MSTAQAALYGFVFVVVLLAVAVLGLYAVSPVGFALAIGVIATALLGTFFMLAVAVAVRIVNGRGVRQMEPRREPAPAVEGQWRELPPPGPPAFVDQTASHGSRLVSPVPQDHA